LVQRGTHNEEGRNWSLLLKPPATTRSSTTCSRVVPVLGYGRPSHVSRPHGSRLSRISGRAHERTRDNSLLLTTTTVVLVHVVVHVHVFLSNESSESSQSSRQRCANQSSRFPLPLCCCAAVLLLWLPCRFFSQSAHCACANEEIRFAS